MNGEYATNPGDAGFLGLVGAAFWLFFLAIYLVFSWLLYRIACNAGQKDTAWWAFIPILNLFLLCKMAQKPMWWVLLCLVPLVNLVILAIMFWKISENCGQHGFWGICMLLPFLNIVALLVLAFSTPKYPAQPAPVKPRPRQPVGV